jgi:hypothetical protein
VRACDGEEEENESVTKSYNQICAENKTGAKYLPVGSSCFYEGELLPFNVSYDGEIISCCSFNVVSSPEEACSTMGETYFNSSYYCSSAYYLLDFKNDEINCCWETPFLKFPITSEFNNSWNSMAATDYCTQNFSEYVRSCTPYKCNYVHPFLGITYPMGVVMDDGENCHIYLDSYESYTYCKINSSFRPAIADHYENLTDGDYLGNVTIIIDTSSNHTPTNAMEQAYANGDCQYVF